MAEPVVRYRHRTIHVPTAPPPTLGGSDDHHHHHHHRQTYSMSTEEPTKEKRIKKLTSILPETLEVINESSERSEYSSESLPESHVRRTSPATNSKRPVNNHSNSASPRSKSRTGSRNDNDNSNHEGDDDDHFRLLGALPRKSTTRKKSTSPKDEIHESSENDESGATDKVTQSDSESAELDNEYDNHHDDYDDDDDDSSCVSAEDAPHGTSLYHYLQKPQRKSDSNKEREPQSFDADNSVMKFDYDGEENDDGDFSCSKHSVSSRSPDDEEELSWRSDPTQSLSDWTITVICRGTQTAEHYHVHKNMLAVGKRKSDYFAGIFREQRKSTKRSNVTELRLPDTAAVMVPMLLDYIYVGDRLLSLSSTTSPGLRYLAQFFGIRVLFERVMKFIQKDLSLKTMVDYYKGCTDLADQKVLGIAARHTARNIHLIDVSHKLVETVDSSFFYKVLTSPGIDGNDKKTHLSLLVAKYCQLHKDTLDGEMFLKLTSEDHLPLIHHSAGLSLLGMEADLVVATSVMSLMTMTSLQQRCIKGLASNWREMTELDPTRTAQVCRKLPSIVVTELLLKSLESAKKEEGRQTSTRVVVKRSSAQKDKLAASNTAKKEYEAELAKLKAEFEAKTAHLQELCYAKDKHIQSYYEELARYQRVPNAPDGKLVTTGKSVQPSMMPSLGKHEVDGYVLVGKKKGTPAYPVFYYKGEERR